LLREKSWKSEEEILLHSFVSLAKVGKEMKERKTKDKREKKSEKYGSRFESAQKCFFFLRLLFPFPSTPIEKKQHQWFELPFFSLVFFVVAKRSTQRNKRNRRKVRRKRINCFCKHGKGGGCWS